MWAGTGRQTGNLWLEKSSAHVGTSGTTCSNCGAHYCLQEGKVGMRWRTEREVVAGKGQFICGAKGCSERRGLASFEVSCCCSSHHACF